MTTPSAAIARPSSMAAPPALSGDLISHQATTSTATFNSNISHPFQTFLTRSSAAGGGE